MCQCHVLCDISSQSLSHNTFEFKGKQNSKRITKRFLNLFASWSIHASCMHVSHFALPCSNPNAPQAAWNIKCSMLSTVRRCSKEVALSTTVSRRWRKKHSPAVGCTKYICPTTFSPRCWVDQTFSWISQTWSIRKSTYTTFCPSTFWVLYAK